MKSVFFTTFSIILLGYKAGFTAMFRGILNKESVRLSIVPLNYWRMGEIPLVLSLLNLHPDKSDKVLNIASPYISSLAIAKKTKSIITMIDILPSTIKHQQAISKANNLHMNINSQQADATKLPFPGKQFSHVLAISSVEHIPQGGDIKAIKEIERVLTVGGRAVISVPYTRGKSYIEYRNGDVYERKGNSKKTYFQRYYSENEIQKRFISNTRLQLETIVYVGEKSLSADPRISLWYYMGKENIFKSFLEIISPFLFLFFFDGYGNSESIKNPIVAVMVFKKRT